MKMVMARPKLSLLLLSVIVLLAVLEFDVHAAGSHNRNLGRNIKTAGSKITEQVAEGAIADTSYVEYVDSSPLGPLYDFLISHRLQRFCKLLRNADVDELLIEMGIFTIFAPTDGSFAFLPGGTLEELERNPQLLREFVLYHIVEGDLQTTSITNELVVESLQRIPLRFNIYGPSPNVFTVSGAEILEKDLQFDIGRLHIIDRPLYPYARTDIMTYLQQNYNEFYQLIVIAGLDAYLSGGTFTIFVPDDKSFEYLSVDLKDALRLNESLAYRIVLSHILPSTFFVRGLNAGTQMKSVEGVDLSFTQRRGLAFVNGFPIIVPDIPATNGVIHVINRVILPEGVDSDCHCKPRGSARQGTPESQRPIPGRTETTRRPVHPVDRTLTPGRTPAPEFRPTSPRPGSRQPVSPGVISRPSVSSGTKPPITPGPVTRPGFRPPILGSTRSPTIPEFRPSQKPAVIPGSRPGSRPVPKPVDEIKTVGGPSKVGDRGHIPAVPGQRPSDDRRPPPQVPDSQDISSCRPPGERPGPRDWRPLCPVSEHQVPGIEYPEPPRSGNQVTQVPSIKSTKPPSTSDVYGCRSPSERPSAGDRRPLCPPGTSRGTSRPTYPQTPSPQYPSPQRPSSGTQPPRSTRKPGKQKPGQDIPSQLNCRMPGEQIIPGDRRPFCPQTIYPPSQISTSDCRSSDMPVTPGDRRPVCPEDVDFNPNCREPGERVIPGDTRPPCQPEDLPVLSCRGPGEQTYPGDRRSPCPPGQTIPPNCRTAGESVLPGDRRPLCTQDVGSSPNCRPSTERATPGDRRPVCPQDIRPVSDCRPPTERATPGDRRPLCPQDVRPVSDCRPPTERAIPGDRRPLCPQDTRPVSDCRPPTERATPGDRRPLCPQDIRPVSDCRPSTERATPGDRRPLCPQDVRPVSDCRPPTERATPGDTRPVCPEDIRPVSACRPSTERATPGDRRQVCPQDVRPVAGCRPSTERAAQGDRRPVCPPGQTVISDCRRPGDHGIPGDRRPICSQEVSSVSDCRAPGEQSTPGDYRPICPPVQEPVSNCRFPGEPFTPGDNRPQCLSSTSRTYPTSGPTRSPFAPRPGGVHQPGFVPSPYPDTPSPGRPGSRTPYDPIHGQIPGRPDQPSSFPGYPTPSINENTVDGFTDTYYPEDYEPSVQRPGQPPRLQPPNEIPTRRPGQPPELRPPSQTPGQRPGQPPRQQPGLTPGRRPGQQPSQIPGQRPGQLPSPTPGQPPRGQGLLPGQRPGQRPGQLPSRTPGQPPRGQGLVPGQTPSQRPYVPTPPSQRPATPSRVTNIPSRIGTSLGRPGSRPGITSSSQFTTMAPVFPTRRPGSQSSHATKGQPYDPSRHPPQRRPTGRFPSVPSSQGSTINIGNRPSNTRGGTYGVPGPSPPSQGSTGRTAQPNRQAPSSCRRRGDRVTSITQSLPLCPSDVDRNEPCQRVDLPYDPTDPRPLCESNTDEEFYSSCRDPSTPFDPADTRPLCPDTIRDQTDCRMPGQPFDSTDYRPLCRSNEHANAAHDVPIQPDSLRPVQPSNSNSRQPNLPQTGSNPSIPSATGCRNPSERPTAGDRRPLCAPQPPRVSQTPYPQNTRRPFTERPGQIPSSQNQFIPNQGSSDTRNPESNEERLVQPFPQITPGRTSPPTQQHTSNPGTRGNHHSTPQSQNRTPGSSAGNRVGGDGTVGQPGPVGSPFRPPTGQQGQRTTGAGRTPSTSSRVTPSVDSGTTIGDDTPRSLFQIVEDPALLIRGHPVQLSKIFELIQKAGLEYILTDPGPHTVFLPSDDAFLRLPKGVIEQLENNPDLLRQVLLYHFTTSEVLPAGVEESYLVPSLQGNQILITMLNGGRLILISGAKAVAVTRASNGIFYVINQLLYPLPQDDIVSALNSRPDLSQLTSFVEQSGLQNLLQGGQPYTLFAPTDNAFSQLPESAIRELAQNVTALRQLLMGHLVEGAHYGREFLVGTVFPNLRGGRLTLKVVSYGYQVNDINIKTPEIVTGTGVIHVIDEILLMPEDQFLIDRQQNTLEGDVSADPSRSSSGLSSGSGGTHSSSMSSGFQQSLSGRLPGSQSMGQVSNSRTVTSHESTFSRRGSVVIEYGPMINGQGGSVSGHQGSMPSGQGSPGQGSMSAGHGTATSDFGSGGAWQRSTTSTGLGSSVSGHGSQSGIQSSQGFSNIHGSQNSGRSPTFSGSRSSISNPGSFTTGHVSLISSHGSSTGTQGSSFSKPGLTSGSMSTQNGVHYSGIAEQASNIGLSRFASLLTATGISDKVQDGGTYTVFAPTDEALSSLSNMNPNQLKIVLLYHIVPQKLGSRSVQNDETASTLLEGKKIRFNVYRHGHVMTALGVPIDKPENGGSSINLVPVNQVLMPPEGDLMKVIESMPNLQEFSKAVKDSRLTWMLSGEGSWTLFAPSDQAFQSLTEEERKNFIENRQAFTDLLKKHLLRGTLFTTGLEDGTQKQTENRKTVTFTVQNGGVAINSVPISYSDVPATNGVLHIIDQFL